LLRSTELLLDTTVAHRDGAAADRGDRGIMGDHHEARTGASLVMVTHDADRKSTRLNSSHVSISYAVFCLKKKNVFYIYLNHPSMPAARHRPLSFLIPRPGPPRDLHSLPTRRSSDLCCGRRNSCSIRPSRIATVRLQTAATEASWVTITRLAPVRAS